MSNFTGIYLKKLRIQSGMTQSELAKKLGYQSATAVELLEIGKTPLDPEHVNALARIFDVEPDDFACRIELDKRKEESVYLPVFNDRSIHDFITGFLAPYLGKPEKADLGNIMNAYYTKHKLPYKHLDPSYKGDIIFKVTNKAMSQFNILNGDYVLIEIFQFDPKQENNSFVGLVNIDDKIQIRNVIPYLLGDKKVYAIYSSGTNPETIISDDIDSFILGKAQGVIRQI